MSMERYERTKGPIGIFDSGYGGLTVLKEILRELPGYDYIYLGDNARSPYGARSFATVKEYTWQCTQWLFRQGCPLVILACNTASAKALRNIQQLDLPVAAPSKRVLGVIRPTAEVIGSYSRTGNIGVLATPGTVASGSYLIEISKFFPDARVVQEACPLWVPLIENNEQGTEGARFFIQKNLDALFAKGPGTDVLLLGCTHYPLIRDRIAAMLPPGVQVVDQGDIVAKSLKAYLARHPEIEELCEKAPLGPGGVIYYTTDSVEQFDKTGGFFLGRAVASRFAPLH